jgi:hypothetical protein
VIVGTCKQVSFAGDANTFTRFGLETKNRLLLENALIWHNKPVRLLPPARLVKVSMPSNPSARLQDEFCISRERMFLLPIWGGVFDIDSFAVSINRRSLLILVVAHGGDVVMECCAQIADNLAGSGRARGQAP